jgi:hypothetical protein
MKKFKLNITINDEGAEYTKNISFAANSKSEISQKLNALKEINKVLDHNDFMSTAELIIEKPAIIPVVKEMLEEGEQLSEAQMMLRLPKYVKNVLKVLKA